MNSKHSLRHILRLVVQLALVLILLLGFNQAGSADRGTGRGTHRVVRAPVEQKGPTTQPQHAPTSRRKPSPAKATPSGEEPASSSLPSGAAVQAVLDPVIDMRLLVIAADGQETDFPAIKAALDQIGIPYNALIATQTTLTADLLSDGGSHGYYQGIILTTGTLVYYDGTNWPSAFDDAEWNTLWTYEAAFGVRQMTSYTAPYGYPDYGLTLVSQVDTTTAPLQVNLTDAGRQVYSYLNTNSAVTIRNAWVYLATPTEGTTPLLLTSQGYAVASIHTYADGRQNLAVTAANNPYLVHFLLLSYGNINWVTKGLFLGDRHVNLSPEVDDLLVDDDIWNTTVLTDTTGLTYRMSGADYSAAMDWQNLVRANYATNAPSISVTLQPDPATGKDAYISSGSKSANYGNATSLVTNSQRATPARSVVQFSLSSIPANATIESATLSLYLYKTTGRLTDNVEAHRLTRDWVEGTGGTNKGVTWNRYNGVNAWQTAGGDYDAASAGSFVANGTGWKTVDLKALTQSWVRGIYPNYGVILLSPAASGNNEKDYYSSDYATDITLRPKLTIFYHTPLPPAGNQASFRMEMAFNGEGASGMYTPDTLTPAVIVNQAAFGWINHTYSHVNLDAATYQQSLTELTQNDTFAVNQLKPAIYWKDEFVQPDISGLANAEFQRAAWDFGTRYLIGDTSRTGWNNPSPNAGIWATYQPGILIVPRHPTNLFYNLTTPAELVSEYNCYYGPTGTCAGGQWRYWDHNLSYSEILDKESDMMLGYLLKGDLDPLMFHQPNLRAYDGVHSLLGDLVDATLAKYNAMYNLPVLSLSLHDIGTRMANRMAYNASGATATFRPGQGITITATRAALVPLTGVSYGAQTETYGGQAISYIHLNAGETVTIPLT